MCDRSKLESLHDVSVTRIGDTFPTVFRRLNMAQVELSMSDTLGFALINHIKYVGLKPGYVEIHVTLNTFLSRAFLKTSKSLINHFYKTLDY